MLLILAHFLQPYISAFRLFDYLSFRALLACLFSLGISILLGNRVITWLVHLKIGQSVRNDGPKSHIIKTGTPTMGGVLIILSVTITTLLFADIHNKYIWLLLFVLIATGLVGFIDDYKKITLKNSKGISGRTKLIFQTLITLIVCIILFYRMHSPSLIDIVLPFTKNISYPFGVVGFFILSYFVIVGSSNSVNLTDGLDGLVSFPIIASSLGLAIFAYIAGNKILSNYLLLPHIIGAQEIVVFCGALVGSCLGFLWFNANPAKVFMGDVGALALGATLGTIAVILRQEIAFFIMGGVFVFEALSVMLQVFSFKLRGKRIFLMAPLHHHFELKGWKENQVVVRFWIISVVLLLISLATIKLR